MGYKLKRPKIGNIGSLAKSLVANANPLPSRSTLSMPDLGISPNIGSALKDAINLPAAGTALSEQWKRPTSIGSIPGAIDKQSWQFGTPDTYENLPGASKNATGAAAALAAIVLSGGLADVGGPGPPAPLVTLGGGGAEAGAAPVAGAMGPTLSGAAMGGAPLAAPAAGGGLASLIAANPWTAALLGTTLANTGLNVADSLKADKNRRKDQKQAQADRQAGADALAPLVGATDAERANTLIQPEERLAILRQAREQLEKQFSEGSRTLNERFAGRGTPGLQADSLRQLANARAEAISRQEATLPLQLSQMNAADRRAAIAQSADIRGRLASILAGSRPARETSGVPAAISTGLTSLIGIGSSASQQAAAERDREQQLNLIQQIYRLGKYAPPPGTAA